MGKLLPILLLLVGTGAGFGAGVFLAPEPVACPEPDEAAANNTESNNCAVEQTTAESTSETSEDDTTAAEFVRMNDQFVVPVLSDGVVRSLVVLSITLEVDAGQTAPIFAVEPKLRDVFLRVLFDHANAGGFNGTYTDATRMEALRRALLEIAQKTAGDAVQNILILDLLRQDV